jgi:predicted MFS family arabinose efflux permease
MASRLGGAISPLLVVPIQIAYGWRMSFYLFGVLGLIWCIVWYTWYRDHPSEKPGLTPSEIKEIGAGAPVAHVSLPWGQALRSWNLWKIMLMYHTYCWGGYFYLSWLHTYLQKGRGFTEGEMKIYSMLPFLAGACGNMVGGSVSDIMVRKFGLKLGRTVVGTVGLTMSALCLFGTAITPNKYMAVAFLTFGYFSMDCMLPVSWSICLDVGRKYAGAVTGAMNMAGQAGSFISSVAFGYMVTYFGSYNPPLIIFAAMLAIAAAIYTRIDPAEQLIPEPQPVPVGAAH